MPEHKTKALLEVMRQNWEHYRHMENERLGAASFYALIVVGTMAFIAQADTVSPRPLLIALDAVSFFGFLVSIRLGVGLLKLEKQLEKMAAEFDIPTEHLGVVRSRDFTRFIGLGLLYPIVYTVAMVVFTWLAILGQFPHAPVG